MSAGSWAAAFVLARIAGKLARNALSHPQDMKGRAISTPALVPPFPHLKNDIKKHFSVVFFGRRDSQALHFRSRAPS